MAATTRRSIGKARKSSRGHLRAARLSSRQQAAAREVFGVFAVARYARCSFLSFTITIEDTPALALTLAHINRDRLMELGMLDVPRLTKSTTHTARGPLAWGAHGRRVRTFRRRGAARARRRRSCRLARDTQVADDRQRVVRCISRKNPSTFTAVPPPCASAVVVEKGRRRTSVRARARARVLRCD